MPRITSAAKLAAIEAENALFLRHLRSGANATIAASFTSRSRETFAARRRVDADFDARWSAALTFARAGLARGGGQAAARGDGMRANGGEYMVGANRNSGLQVRRARPGHVTARGEAAFLEGLAATANIRLAADAAGVDPRAFYKRRASCPDFARRMQDALAAGYEAVEFALVGAALRTLAPEAGAPEEPAPADDSGAPAPDLPARMTIDQALALIGQRTKTLAIGARHLSGGHAKPVTRESALAAMEKAVAAVERRIEREAQRGGRPQAALPDRSGE